MRSRAAQSGFVLAVVLVLGGCSHPERLDPVACRRGERSNSTVRLAGLTPSTLRSHGERVVLELDGELPTQVDAPEFFRLVVTVGDESTAHDLPSDVIRKSDGSVRQFVSLRLGVLPIGRYSLSLLRLVLPSDACLSCSVGEDLWASDARELTALDCVGQVVSAPAAGETELAGDGFSAPLPLDLGAAGRTQRVRLRSTGGAPLTVDSFDIVGDPAFSIEGSCGALPYDEACDVLVVFHPSRKGEHRAQLHVNGSGAVNALDLVAEALPHVQGLDVSFGGVLLTPRHRSITPAWDDSSVALVRDEAPSTTLERVEPGGLITPLPLSITGAKAILAPGPVGLAYLLDAESFRRVDRNGGVDPTFQFSEIDSIFEPSEGFDPVGAAALSSGGVMLVETQRVWRLGKSGAPAQGFGDGSSVALPFGVAGADLAVDSGGRLYVGSTKGLVRVDSSGAVEVLSDEPHPILAADPSGTVLAGDGVSFTLYDGSGQPMSLSFDVSSVVDAAFDGSGRLYLSREAGDGLRLDPTGRIDPLPRIDVSGGHARYLCPTQGACWVHGSTGVEEYLTRLASDW